MENAEVKENIILSVIKTLFIALVAWLLVILPISFLEKQWSCQNNYQSNP